MDRQASSPARRRHKARDKTVQACGLLHIVLSRCLLIGNVTALTLALHIRVAALARTGVMTIFQVAGDKRSSSPQLTARVWSARSPLNYCPWPRMW
jgi:hypothetical protein